LLCLGTADRAGELLKIVAETRGFFTPLLQRADIDAGSNDAGENDQTKTGDGGHEADENQDSGPWAASCSARACSFHCSRVARFLKARISLKALSSSSFH
jgi:hypothetical protein